MSSGFVLFSGNDAHMLRCYDFAMAIPRHDWYLKEWLRAKCVTQQWVADELRVQKSMISRKATGKTPYDRDDVNAIAALLHLRPYELLMHPDEAHQIQRVRQALDEEQRLRAIASTQRSDAPSRSTQKPDDLKRKAS